MHKGARKRIIPIIVFCMIFQMIIGCVTNVNVYAASNKVIFVDGGGTNGLNVDAAQAAYYPDLVSYNNELYAFWQEWSRQGSLVRAKKYDGNAWTVIDEGGLNNISPAYIDSVKAIVYRGELYAIWAEKKDDSWTNTHWLVRVKKYDGTSWTFAEGSGVEGLPKGYFSDAMRPSLAVYNDELYAIFTERTDRINRIKVYKYNGSSWTNVGGEDGLTYTIRYADDPALGVYNNELYAAWFEPNDSGQSQLRVKKYNGTSWVSADGNGTAGLNFDGTRNGFRPNLVEYNGRLCAVWYEFDSNYNGRIRVKEYDGNSWTFVDGNNISGISYEGDLGSLIPRAQVFQGKLYVCWEENTYNGPRVRAKVYDGTSWKSADGGTGLSIGERGSAPTFAVNNNKLYVTWMDGNMPQIRVAQLITSEAPIINTQPVSKTRTVGQTATFTVTASGDAPLTYQWSKNGTPLVDGGSVSGANSSTLTITNAQVDDSGDYSVTVTGSGGSVTSSTATLTVEQPIGITIGQVTGRPGETVTVPVSLSNVPASGIGATGILVGYDNTKLTLTKVTAGEIIQYPEGFHSDVNFLTQRPGYVAVLYVSPNDNAIKTNGTLANLTFKISDTATGTYGFGIETSSVLIKGDTERTPVHYENLVINLGSLEVTPLPTYTVTFVPNGGTQVGNQSVKSGEKASLPEGVHREGYDFIGWYTDAALTSPFDFSSPINSDITLYAKWDIKKGITVNITSLNGDVTGNESSYSYGDTAQLTAVPNNGYIFESWTDTDTGKVVSLNPTYSFIVTNDTRLTANYKEVNQSQFTVKFLSESGQVLSIQKVAQGEDAVAPAAIPSKPGYNFTGWDKNFTNVQSDLIIKPLYSAIKSYTLTVIGGTIPSGITSYNFDSKVTVKADSAPNGQQFSHWEINGAVVSYESTYTFNILNDTTVTAVYSEVAAVKVPSVTIDPDVVVNSSTGKISFLGQINVPSDFTKIECGVVALKSDTVPSSLDFYTSGVVRAKSSTQTSAGQFMLNKANVQPGETWYAKAYLVYKDSLGNLTTIYSGMVNGTMTVQPLPTYTVNFVSNGGTQVGNQSVKSGEKASLPDGMYREGYDFIGWYTDAALTNPFDFNSAVSSDITLYAKWDIKKGITVNITSLNGDVTGNQSSYGYGDTAQLTAVPNSGYIFESWADTDTGKVVSLNPIYSFIVTKATSLTANYKEVNQSEFTVKFLSESGQVLSIQKVAQGEDAAAPAAIPSKPGYNFTGWDKDFTNVQSDLIVKPLYSVIKTYTLTVIGGTIPSGITSYNFDSKVTVKADSAPNGQQFSHWEINGAVVSYEPMYSFNILNDTTVTAVYSEAAAIKVPSVTIDPDVVANPSTGKMSFLGQINVPSGFTKIECGVVALKSDIIPSSLDFYTTGVVRAKSSTQTSAGQFMMNKANVQPGETWYAKAYLVYKDSSGNLNTIYSDMVNGTMP
ncbi:putative repeat protein (TIGR02543 family) [Clostridium pascui]|uniref:InlB B-repeat-containing protein n=1 Tax=Clostridium pascui TaxID=46609 RepID=UPI001959654D|nr:InlB B-repeat-containing protein [Clostridium pascui]MBM7871303.1 putative repeat protein (TIGR02543 family) [Clostridium pascui]